MAAPTWHEGAVSELSRDKSVQRKLMLPPQILKLYMQHNKESCG